MLKIYKDEPKETVWQIRLVKTEIGSIVLKIVNDHGEELYGGNLVRITKDGHLHRFGSIGNKYNLDTDIGGRLKLKK